MMETKKCSGECGEVKPLDEYGKDRHSKDGLTSRCLVCKRKAARVANAAFRERRRQDPERWEAYRQYNAERHERLKDDPEHQERRRQYLAAYHATERGQAIRWEGTYRQHAKRAGVTPVFGERFYPSDVVANRGNTCNAEGCDETEDLHLDHIVPVILGGPHSLGNAQFLCSHHNLTKGASLPKFRSVWDVVQQFIETNQGESESA